MIVGCDSVSVAKFFTSQPCVNVLWQNHDSITLVSSPKILFCVADSRTMQNKITECPAEEAAAAAAAAVDDRATIDWGRATKLGVEMKNILPSSLGEIDGGGGAPGFVLQERGEENKLYFWGR